MTPAPRFRRVDSAERSRNPLALVLAILPLGGAAVAADSDPPARPLGPVTVTATRAEREVLDVPGHVTVIGREAIDRSGAPDLPSLLRRQSGIFVTNTTTSPAGTRVEARGFNNGGALGSSTLVQVDGRRVNEADTGDTDWALLDLDRVERIEIIRGPASAIYGDNAIGGVINIVTRPREEADAPWRATLRGGGGSFASGEGSLRLDAARGPLRGSLFAQGLTSDGYRDRSGFWNVNLDGSLEAALGERVVLGLGGGWHEDERNLPGGLSADEIRRLGRRAAAPGTEQDRSEVRRWFLRAWLDAELARDVRLRVQPHGRRREDRVALSFANAFPPPGRLETRITTDKDSAGVDLSLQIDRSIGEFPNRLTLGLDFLHDHTDRDFRSDFSDAVDDSRRWVLGGYLQNEFSILDNLFLAAGVRYDYADYELRRAGQATLRPDYSVWSPKASLTYRVLGPLSLYFSYARGFRLPNFDEDLPLLGSIPDLVPQESNSYEVGAKLQSRRVGAALALYRMDVENEVIFDPFFVPPGSFPGANQNFDEVRHQGIEVSLDATAIESWLEVWASYTYDDVEIQRHDPTPLFEGKRMPMIPRHRGTLGVRTLLPLGFEIAANANLVGSRFPSNDFLNAGPELDPYGSVDFFFTWRPRLGPHWEGFLRFAIRNATDEDYADFGADFSGPTFSVPQVFYPAPKRSYDLRFVLTHRP